MSHTRDIPKGLFEHYCVTFEVPHLKDTINVEGYFKRERALKRLAQEMHYTQLRQMWGAEVEKEVRIYDYLEHYWPNLFPDDSLWTRLKYRAKKILRRVD